MAQMTKGRLGIIGCGQLSQMLGEAANRQGFAVSYLCVDETPVVAGLGPIYYPDQLDEFLAACDAITVERESLPDDMLRQAANTGLAPNYDALVTLRERDTQKAMLDALGIKRSSRWLAMLVFGLMPLAGMLLYDVLVHSRAHWSENVPVWSGGLVIGILLHISTTIFFEASDDHHFNLNKLLVTIAGLVIAVLTTGV